MLSRLAFRSFFAWLSWLISSTAAKGVARRDTYQHSYEGGFARRARAVPFAQGSFLIFCLRIIFLRALRRTPPLACVFRKRRWRRFFWGYFVVLSLRAMGRELKIPAKLGPLQTYVYVGINNPTSSMLLRRGSLFCAHASRVCHPGHQLTVFPSDR